MTIDETLPQLLTIDQLANRLGITVRHVRRLVAERRIPYLKVGKLVRFDPDEITCWLANSRVDVRPPSPIAARPPGLRPVHRRGTSDGAA